MVSTSSDYERFQVKGINYEYMQYTQMYKFVSHILDLEDFSTLHGVAELSSLTVSETPDDVLAELIANRMLEDLKQTYGDRFNA